MDIPFCILLTFQAFLYFVSRTEHTLHVRSISNRCFNKNGLKEMYTDNKTRERCGRMTDLTTLFQIK